MYDIQIDKHTLAYDPDEYEGELFRMKLSCSTAVLSQKTEDCLFFIIWGTSNVTERKYMQLTFLHDSMM